MAIVRTLVMMVCVALGPMAPAAGTGGSGASGDTGDTGHTLHAQQRELVLTRGLSITGVSSWGRRAINTDAVAARLVEGEWTTPKAGATLAGDLAEGAKGPRWQESAAALNGDFTLPRGSYLSISVKSERERVMLLQASGHSLVYVNGEPRTGDPYAHGYVKLPVHMRAGENQLLFAHAGRGAMRAVLLEPTAPVMFLREDTTLPTFGHESMRVHHDGAVVMLNATLERQEVVVRAFAEGHESVTRSHNLVLQPCSVLKTPIEFPIHAADDAAEARTVLLASSRDGQEWDRMTIELKRAGPRDRRVVTFFSGIDMSVQYYAVVPRAAPEPGSSHADKPGLALSLHGASVEATSQAAAYAPKPDLVIVCPTNRRPFGFDWEDWGRVDALEALTHATSHVGIDRRRQYVTGHSMGGHGTWQLGVLHPELFAAIAPSAGWLSFETYAAARAGADTPTSDPVMRVLRDAARSSDTIAKLDRLRGKGVYILHGDADDNVPVSEARRAREELKALDIPFEFHEQPGAGHWWDIDGKDKRAPNTGAACVDWPGIFEMFATRSLMSVPPEDPLDATHAVVWSDRAYAADADPRERHLTTGAFKNAFNHRFALVFGTGGTPEEAAWSRAKARFDAEQWWYRGNGHARVLSDQELLDHLARQPVEGVTIGNVVLYGNTTTNAAARVLLKDAKVSVADGRIVATDRTIEGDDLGVLLLHRTRHADRSMLVGLVGGTGVRGMRSTDRIPYFLSGVGIPDVLVVRSSIWTTGPEDVLMAGVIEDSTTLRAVWRHPQQ